MTKEVSWFRVNFLKGEEDYILKVIFSLKVICFLREVNVPIDAISQLLEEEHPGKSDFWFLIEQQESLLMEEIQEKQE